MNYDSQRVAIVTGGAQGIGRAIAERLSRDGARVAVLDLNEPTDAVAAISAAGGTAIGVTADVSDREQVRAAVAQVEAQLGPVTILVNNAGLHANPMTAFEDLSVAQWERMQRVDLDSVFHFCQAVLPSMRAAGWGRIVNMSSGTINALTPPGMSHYIAAKTGVVGLTRAIATEVGEAGIVVNAVAPGGVQTPGLEEMSPEGVMEFVASQQAIRRVIQPEDISGVVAFLASDDCRMMTAQTLFVDGGTVRAG